MEKATIIGIDLAKRVFQVHAAAKDGRPVLRKKVSRAQLLGFLAKQPRAIVAMEACATAHEWGRAFGGRRWPGNCGKWDSIGQPPLKTKGPRTLVRGPWN